MVISSINEVSLDMHLFGFLKSDEKFPNTETTMLILSKLVFRPYLTRENTRKSHHCTLKAVQ